MPENPSDSSGFWGGYQNHKKILNSITRLLFARAGVLKTPWGAGRFNSRAPVGS